MGKILAQSPQKKTRLSPLYFGKIKMKYSKFHLDVNDYLMSQSNKI